MNAIETAPAQDYAAFIAEKARRAPQVGIDAPADSLPGVLYPYQRAVTSWALRCGRAAIFADCGLGKTLMQLAWANRIQAHAGFPALIVAPLAVADQTAEEGRMLGLDVRHARTAVDIREGDSLIVTNYQRLHHFTEQRFGGLVLDESSILKNMRGAVRNQIVDFASAIPYRLACTATPAPNELLELLNHAEYLGVMSVHEALALWFVNDQAQAQSWRLKGHARADFWRWVSTWAVAFRRPADIGHEQDGFDLPMYQRVDHLSNVEPEPEDGALFAVSGGIAAHRAARRATLDDRVSRCADVVNASSEPWAVWCELNSESEALARAIPDAVEIRGSDDIDVKEERLRAFSSGRARVIVTKPTIAGHGLNWQHCARVAFVGVGYSYEAFYQAVRRVWRYGQKRPVEVHVFGAATDREVLTVIGRKEETAMQVYDFATPAGLGGAPASTAPIATEAEIETAEGDGWTIHLGDSVDTIARVENASIGLSVFSPPFPGMYVYTDDPRDMGNVNSIGQMVEQFGYLATQMRAKMIPGRSVIIHITQGVAQLQRDGFVGLRDFRGQLIQRMIDSGFVHYGEIAIDKNPQVKAIRTKDAGLLFVQLERDAAKMHVAMPDMLLQFRAPGDNPQPVKPDVTREEWIRWARPVWPGGDTDDDGIVETDTLNAAEARIPEDERHICPLQLGLIRRCIRLWSNPGDLVYSPFAGIGSEGVSAIKLGRRFVGGELKRAYFNIARQHIANEANQGRLW